MNILIWILTAIHIMTAVVLVVLVLMQKSSEQGVGAAFGGQMTEAVFGGSITPLVKMTIWCACILLTTTLTLAILHTRRANRGDNNAMINKIQQTAPAAPAAPAMPASPVLPTPAPAPVGTPVPATAK
jgi:preprotein translocase subunit SecG